ncbi:MULTISPECIES: transcriptional regulator [Cupriavidus]|nr:MULTISPECIES: transcriptional regulator [Cupriavidus]QYY29187.1 transcriptional regulator [Cupriavidus pinatubonensis]TPQ33600.1 transcriptional regulator [Cupriavidus pinatubonensis]
MNDIPETSALARHDARGYGIAVLPISFFRQSEEVDMEGVWILTELIASDGCWLAPIPVEASHGIVMDGNHRLRAAMRLGLKCLPCIPLCYGDARICVRDWHSGEPFDTRCILHTVAAGALLPHKSTRHFFEPSLPRTSIPLERLRTQGR